MALTLVAVACRAEPTTPTAEDKSKTSGAKSTPRALPDASRHDASPADDGLPTRFPAASRVVAFGDAHGDLAATRAVLRLVGAVGEGDTWAGGDLVVVQTGDQLDRGDGERAILELLDRIAEEAEAAGGAVHALNGNHEIMNVVGDLRYITPGGFADFANVEHDPNDTALQGVDAAQRGRVAAFRPGGPYAKLMAKRNTVVIVGDSVFAHGGVRPEHVEFGLEKINAGVRTWMSGAGGESIVKIVMHQQSPVWTRKYSMPPEDCALLGRALQAVGAKRMVVGHTVQKNGITSACDDRVWRIDTGMAAHYGGTVQALEIIGDRVTVLREREDAKAAAG